MRKAQLLTAFAIVLLSAVTIGKSVAQSAKPSAVESMTPYQILDRGPFRTPEEKAAYYHQKLREALARNRSINGPRDPRSNSYYPTMSKTINFALAPDTKLTSSQVDKYIDPRITGKMRAYVRLLMLQMPIGQRHNVRGYIGGSPSYQNAYSNTWEDLNSLRCCLGHDLGNGTARLDDGRIVPLPHP